MSFSRTLTLAALLGAAAAAYAQTLTFEDYYPNRVTRTLVFDYGSSAEGVTQWNYQGTLTRSPSTPETIDGVRYETVTIGTDGLPDFYPKEWKTYHLETGNGLVSGQMSDAGEMEMHLEFPATAKPGEPWPEKSEFWESETPVIVPRVETDAGTFEKCIRVDRVRHDPANEQTLTNTTTYCPDISVVRSTIEHTFKDFRSVTEMNLIEIRP